MEQFTAVLSIISPIFVAVLLGVLAKKKNIMTAQQMSGLQQFVVKFGLPCVLFNSCFTADFGAESVTSMMLVVPLQLMSCIWAFWARKKVFCYWIESAVLVVIGSCEHH
jgi:predicted permease